MIILVAARLLRRPAICPVSAHGRRSRIPPGRPRRSAATSRAAMSLAAAHCPSAACKDGEFSAPGAKPRRHCGSMRSASYLRRGCARNACSDRATPSGLRVLVRHTAPNTPRSYGAGGGSGFLEHRVDGGRQDFSPSALDTPIEPITSPSSADQQASRRELAARRVSPTVRHRGTRPGCRHHGRALAPGSSCRSRPAPRSAAVMATASPLVSSNAALSFANSSGRATKPSGKARAMNGRRAP